MVVSLKYLSYVVPSPFFDRLLYFSSEISVLAIWSLCLGSTLGLGVPKRTQTHSSVLAWRIPGTGEPGGLPSMGSHRVGHDWSDLAAAAAARGPRGLSAWSYSRLWCVTVKCTERIGKAKGAWRSPGPADICVQESSCSVSPEAHNPSRNKLGQHMWSGTTQGSLLETQGRGFPLRLVGRVPSTWHEPKFQTPIRKAAVPHKPCYLCQQSSSSGSLYQL